MSVQLRPDEALEALQAVDAESAARWEAILCAATTAIGAELARHYDCESGIASAEGVAFGGLCVPMNPRRPDQPLPDGWEQFDGGAAGEWEGECERLAAEGVEAGAPTGETAGDGPTCDDAEAEGLQTYRITETVAYLVKAEDEAHAERRFVCEVGIHAACFHAVEGRTIELEEGEFTCTACGRSEDDCSRAPCPAVIADRES